MSENNLKKNILEAILSEIKNAPDALALWEGGSAATGYLDQYSDLDLCVLSEDTKATFEHIENALKRKFQIIREWSPPPFWTGVTPKMYSFKDAPKYFKLDVSVFDRKAETTLSEFMIQERHGLPVVHFDKPMLIKPANINREQLVQRQRLRIKDITSSFKIYRDLALKEFDRGNFVDAFSFYQFLVRQTVEILGIIHRPDTFDFGLRYINRSFPHNVQEQLQNLLFVGEPSRLAQKIFDCEEIISLAIEDLKQKFP